MKERKSILAKAPPLLGIMLLIISNFISAVRGSFTPLTTAIGVVGLVLFLTIFLRFERANVRYYINVLLYSLFALFMGVFIYLLISLSPKQFDLTKAGYYSLSLQSKEFLESLDKEVKIVAFTNDRRSVEDFIQRYAYASDKITYEILNPFKDTLIAKEFDTNVVPGDIFIISGDKKKKIGELSEKVFTNTIAEVVQEGTTVVYFLQGHGECPLDKYRDDAQQQVDTSLSEIKRLLTERAITCQELNIAEKGEIPQDCALLVCAGPTSDLFPHEVDIIRDYLNAGGRGIFMFDPVPSPLTSFKKIPALMNDFGVLIERNMILDTNPISQALYGDPLAPLVYRVGEHPILEGLAKNKAFFVPKARTIRKIEPMPEHFKVESLLQTSDYAWDESIDMIYAKEKIEVPDKETLKPLPVAVAAVKTLTTDTLVAQRFDRSNEARLVVFGDSDMFINSNISSSVALLFLNSVNWLNERKDLIAIPEKLLESTPVVLRSATSRLIFIILVITLPSLVFFGGLGYTMIRRRVR